jgi:hypothetical protein
LPWLSELEHHDKLPSLDVLIRLARVYGLSVQDLLAPVYFEDGTPQILRRAVVPETPLPANLDRAVFETVSASLASDTALNEATRNAIAEAVASGVRTGLACWLEDLPRRSKTQEPRSA